MVISSSEAASHVVEQLLDDAAEPAAFQSNMAMKMRAGAAYDVAGAKLERALMDLQLLASEDEWEGIGNAQNHWRAYRNALEDGALRQYDGGSHATLAAAFVGTETPKFAGNRCPTQWARQMSVMESGCPQWVESRPSQR